MSELAQAQIAETEQFTLVERAKVAALMAQSTVMERVVGPIADAVENIGDRISAHRPEASSVLALGLAGVLAVGASAATRPKYMPFRGKAAKSVITGFYERGCEATLVVDQSDPTQHRSNLGKLSANFRGDTVTATLKNVPKGALVCGAIGSTVGSNEQFIVKFVKGKAHDTRKKGDLRRMGQLGVYIRPKERV